MVKHAFKIAAGWLAVAPAAAWGQDSTAVQNVQPVSQWPNMIIAVVLVMGVVLVSVMSSKRGHQD